MLKKTLELKKGSIAGVSVLNADDIKESECVAGGGRCEIYKAWLHNNKVTTQLTSFLCSILKRSRLWLSSCLGNNMQWTLYRIMIVRTGYTR